MRSPLWTALDATQPLFIVDDGSGQGATIDDHRITSIKIEGGTTMAGLSTAGATVEVAGYQAYVQPEDLSHCTIQLSNYGAARLSALTGKTTASIKARFRGRVTAHDVTDTGDGDRTTKMRTTLTAQDWASFISQLDKGAWANRNEKTLHWLYQSLFTRAGIPGMFSLQFWGSTWHWVRFTADEDALTGKLIPTSEAISRYIADVGNLVRADRDGYPKAWSHDHIITLAEDWKTYNPDPLQRSQVLSPVTWRRPATIPKSVAWTQTKDVGNQTGTISYSFTPSGTLVTRAVDIDMLHLWDIAWDATTGSGYVDAMRARYYTERGTDMVLDTVTVDVLQLIRRNAGTDRAVVGQLLAMHHGDPLTLGYDWPAEVRGVHFAQKISHSITRDAWTIALDLVPARHVTGRSNPGDLAGRTWDTAYTPPTVWETPSTTWEASP